MSSSHRRSPLKLLVSLIYTQTVTRQTFQCCLASIIQAPLCGATGCRSNKNLASLFFFFFSPLGPLVPCGVEVTSLILFRPLDESFLVHSRLFTALSRDLWILSLALMSDFLFSVYHHHHCHSSISIDNGAEPPMMSLFRGASAVTKNSNLRVTVYVTDGKNVDSLM